MLRRDTGSAVASGRGEVENMFHGGKLVRANDEGPEAPRTIQDLGDSTRVQTLAERVRAFSDFSVAKLFRELKWRPPYFQVRIAFSLDLSVGAARLAPVINPALDVRAPEFG